MEAKFERIEYVSNSRPPRIRFYINITNDGGEMFNVFGFGGDIRYKYLMKQQEHFFLLNELVDTEMSTIQLNPKGSYTLTLDYILDPYSKIIIENKRLGDVKFRIWLKYYFNKIEQNGRIQPVNSTREEVRFGNSNEIRIARSDWANILSEAGYDKYQLIELPLDYGDIIEFSKSLQDKGFQNRLLKAGEQLSKIMRKMDEGQWREAVGECRIAFEALTKDMVQNEKGELISAKRAITELLRKSGFPQNTIRSFNMLIEQMKSYTSLQHHIKSESGKEIELPVPMDREDALFAVSTLTTIINLLARKFQKQIL